MEEWKEVLTTIVTVAGEGCVFCVCQKQSALKCMRTFCSAVRCLVRMPGWGWASRLFLFYLFCLFCSPNNMGFFKCQCIQFNVSPEIFVALDVVSPPPPPPILNWSNKVRVSPFSSCGALIGWRRQISNAFSRGLFRALERSLWWGHNKLWFSAGKASMSTAISTQCTFGLFQQTLPFCKLSQ